MIKPWLLQKMKVFIKFFFSEVLFLTVLMHNQEEIGQSGNQMFLNIEQKYDETMTQMVKQGVTEEVVLVTCLVFALNNCKVNEKFILPFVLMVFREEIFLFVEKHINYVTYQQLVFLFYLQYKASLIKSPEF